MSRRACENTLVNSIVVAFGYSLEKTWFLEHFIDAPSGSLWLGSLWLLLAPSGLAPSDSPREAHRSAEKHREAQRNIEKHRESRRSIGKHREAQRSTQKHTEAHRSTEKNREAQRSMFESCQGLAWVRSCHVRPGWVGVGSIGCKA